MKTKGSLKLRNIAVLMFFSFSLLLAFAAHWLSSQYEREKHQLQKDLTRLFNNVQEDISDTLLLSNIVQPVLLSAGCPDSSKNGHAAISQYKDERTSRKGVSLLLQNVRKLSKAEEKHLFRSDTAIFNDIFNRRMQSQGWDFDAQWVHAADTNTEEAKDNIVIMSKFFTNEHGVIVSNYQSYLNRRMLTPCLFIVFLLVVTGIAFRSTYISLKKQMSLATLKDDFISNMSHELKTPVATVKVALEALHSFNALQQPERGKEYLEMAVLEMNRLELLVNRALSTSLLESGKLALQKEECDLKKLTEEVIWGMQPRLLQNEARVILETSGNNFISRLDKMHTQGVLINLIDNSMKYANKPAEIRLQLTEEEDSIQLTVTDNGPGIPEEYRERVFEKFFRVPTGNRHNTKGYGLGLSYAAQVMQQHMGSIRVANLPQGGCCFTLTF